MKVMKTKKKILTQLVWFMTMHGFPAPVLGFVRQRAARMDQALVRHFIANVMQLTAPPYSPDFAEGLLGVVNAQKGGGISSGVMDSLRKMLQSSLAAGKQGKRAGD